MEIITRPPDYRRHLPHYTPNDAPYFLTFNLTGSLSKDQRERLKRREMPFHEYDRLLHEGNLGWHWLREPEIAQEVYRGLIGLEELVWLLHAFTIMSNHVHLVMALRKEQELRDVMQQLKGTTARQCNLVMGRGGSFWQHESYDRVLRRKEYNRVIRYVLNNPIKAGIVSRWDEYRWTYLNPALY